jgi:hypothetical protein
MFTNEMDFVAKDISALLAGVQGLDVLFATYRNVGDYENGSVETKKEGLTITVRNGDAREYYEFAAQLEVESATEIKDQEGVSSLVVVYAGLSAFREAVAFARRIKRDHPAAKIVVVTCDCELSWKKRELEPMLQGGELEAVVVTSYCGGRTTMCDILKKIVAIFPVPSPAVTP